MPDFTTMAATATGTTTANMPATTARGCRPRHRRGTGNGLHTLLASIAIISCFLRILYADESPVRFRPAGGCGAFSRRSSGTGTIHRMLSLLRCRVGQFLSYCCRSCRTGKCASAISPVASVGCDCAGMIV